MFSDRYGHRLIVALLLCVSVAACQKPEPTHQIEPVAKPALSHDSSSVLNPLYQAKLKLARYHNNAALDLLKEAQSKLSYFHHKRYGNSDLLVEITYLNAGALTKLYVPTLRDEKRRYDETKSAIMHMTKHKIDPLEYRLVTFDRKTSKDALQTSLNKAIALLSDPSIEDRTDASLQADRGLNDFLSLLHVRSYQGEAKNRLSFHMQASEVFLSHNAFNIARNALVYARQALEGLRGSGAKNTEPVAARLDQIEQAIDRRDPSLIAKIGQTIDGWISGASH